MPISEQNAVARTNRCENTVVRSRILLQCRVNQPTRHGSPRGASEHEKPFEHAGGGAAASAAVRPARSWCHQGPAACSACASFASARRAAVPSVGGGFYRERPDARDGPRAGVAGAAVAVPPWICPCHAGPTSPLLCARVPARCSCVHSACSDPCARAGSSDVPRVGGRAVCADLWLEYHDPGVPCSRVICAWQSLCARPATPCARPP